MTFQKDITILIYSKNKGKLRRAVDEIAKRFVQLHGKNNVTVDRIRENSRYNNFQCKVWVNTPILRLPDEKPMEEQR